MLAFVLALLVNLPLRGVGIFRTAYFMPVVIGLGTSSLLWVWLLNDRVGVFNQILMRRGADREADRLVCRKRTLPWRPSSFRWCGRRSASP